MKDFIETDIFKKLNQLDRIEYILGSERIDKKYDADYSMPLIRLLFYFAGFFLLFTIVSYSAFGADFVTRIIKPVFSVTKIFCFFIVTFLIIDLVITIKGFIAKRNFNKEFFKIEVKKK